MFQFIDTINDVQKLVPSQATEFRRHRSEVTPELALEAMAKYLYFVGFGGKRPFLHSPSRIVAPVTPEVIRWLQNFTKVPLAMCEAWWPRQMVRFERSLDGGLKIYHDTILGRMKAKRAERATKQLLQKVEPPRVDIQLATTVPTEVAVVNRFAETPVFYRKISGDKIVVLALLDADGGVKKSTVYHIKDGVAIEKDSSKAQKYTEDELAAKGWKMAKLEDDGFEPILVLLGQIN